MECFLEYDEDTITDLLPSPRSYGWDSDLMNDMAWAHNAYKVIFFEPDFERYGCIPSWFPTTDSHQRKLSPQGQVDRFIYLVERAYGGFLGDHQDVSPEGLAEAILEIYNNMGEFLDDEEAMIAWELLGETNVSDEKE
ncbi:MAG: hypothetical protein JXB15_06090 [Anaerolineales bacterium]|nr:hypothetical protein [Anaerolineales bacterium]